jgi:hypothetical protein
MGGAATVRYAGNTRGVAETTWTEIRQVIMTAPYPVTALPYDDAHAEECLTVLELTTRSWLGAVIANTGGLVVDHGWFA